MDSRALADELIASFRHGKPLLEPLRELARGEMGILMYLSAKHEAVVCGELSHVMDISTGRVAISLKNLENKKLIRREPDTIDCRRVRVTPTERGIEFASEGRRRIREFTIELLEKLGERDAKEFVRIIKRVEEIEHPAP